MREGTPENTAALGMSAGKHRFAARVGVQLWDFEARRGNTLRLGRLRPPGQVAMVTKRSQETEKADAQLERLSHSFTRAWTRPT